jgi:hypothetical protein
VTDYWWLARPALRVSAQEPEPDVLLPLRPDPLLVANPLNLSNDDWHRPINEYVPRTMSLLHAAESALQISPTNNTLSAAANGSGGAAAAAAAPAAATVGAAGAAPPASSP